MDSLNALLARKYARAFLGLYGEGITLAYLERIDDLCKFLMLNPSVISLLKFPGTTEKTIESMLKMVSERFSLSEPFESLVRLLLKHKRIELLRPVLQALVILFYEHINTMTFSITSAHELDEQSLERIKQFLMHKTGKNIVISYAIDSGLIAGIRAQSATLLWEYSIAKQLNRLSLTSIV